ncbi:hypothetical protein SAMN05421823_103643 [Catalinimonas alkaloidigena]|uniref:Uncharacterized protein n=1 Tax=Catalinimonas alkaloidigena TaxID=1075417 RepID=A0A1G9F1K2_9BACT|nr:hypothetical protein [Catalinimonas alkaloidigena]SDK82155.1 hypothetical protein SAMN05421823_103643 [Catalinimonas alkaloidigena]
MPTPSADFRQAIRALPDREKEKLLLRIVRRDADLYAQLAFELDLSSREEVYDETAAAITEIMEVEPARRPSRALTRAIRKAREAIARYKYITNDLKGEVDLTLHMLRFCYDRHHRHFDDRYASFYKTTARLTVRVAQLICRKLHEDYYIEYEPDLDWFLSWAYNHPRRERLNLDLPRALADVK